MAISSLADMEILFDGIPLDTITTSMTINGPAAVIWAMYLANAQKRGIPLQKLGGTIQNDVLKEYTSQNSYIFPPVPSIRLIVDTMEFGTMHVPRWNTISISGYHIREAGSTAVQELAFTLANGFEYVKAGIARGLNVDDFAPRLSFFFDCHNDFFEEIAKFRAARRIWAREIRQRFHAGERAQWMRIHTQTAGCSLTEQQPENNIIRTTLQALAAVLGGTQSLHTNSMDEVMALPSEKAVRIALRTQQIIEKESGVTRTVDPMGGSYFIEALTDEMEKAAYEYFARSDAAGGGIPCIESGFFLREIADSAYSYQKAIENKQQIIIGVNEHTINEPIEIPIHEKDADGERRHLSRLNKIRLVRDNEVVSTKLAALRIAAGTNQNLMPFLIEAVSAYATLGEICNILRKEFGEYSPLTIY
jgi:methylmalonyl-CoA mutase N-terminal domain/subunit